MSEWQVPAALSGAERFERLVNAVRDYAIYLLDRDGHVASWNAGAERFKGYAAAEIIGQHFSRFYTPEDQAAGLPHRALETAATQGTYEAEGWRVRKDGTRFWTSAVIDPVLDETGALIGFAKVTRDITERRAAERALLESGTAFTLYLPLAGGVAPIATRPPRVAARPLPRRRVLLVEDNEGVGQFARGLLEELGQTVTWRSNGQAALELLERAPDEIDLVFTDVIMPGISGLDLARAVRSRWPALPVVLTTGYSDALVAEQDHGFALLRKPYSLDRLAAILA